MDAETKQPHGRTRSSSVPVSGAHRWRALLREPLSTELYQHTWPPVLVTAGKSQTLSGHPPPDPAGLLGQLDGELGLIARDDNVGQKSLSYTAQNGLCSLQIQPCLSCACRMPRVLYGGFESANGDSPLLWPGHTLSLPWGSGAHCSPG